MDMRKIVYGLFILLAGCGYMDNDGYVFKKAIVGNIEYSQQENSTAVSLIFARDAHSNDIIIQDCKGIFYDSANKKIYIEEELNKYISNYYEIIALNPQSTNYVEAYKQHEITKEAFDSLSSTHAYLIFSKVKKR